MRFITSWRKTYSLLIVFLPVMLFAQDNLNSQTTLFESEVLLKEYFSKMRNANTDEEKRNINDSILSKFQSILKTEESFYYNFDSLKIGKLRSDDEILRIYTWNVPLNAGNHEYYGFIQIFDKKNKIVYLHSLVDKSKLSAEIAKTTLMPDNWYGALYYDIIDTDIKKEKVYTVLGFDFNNIFTQKKVIDIIEVKPDFSISIGKPIFSDGKNIANRIIFEYSVRSQMTLRFDANLEMLVFDHLSPNKPSQTGNYQFYGPDFSYDGFKFHDNFWVFQKDIDVRN